MLRQDLVPGSILQNLYISEQFAMREILVASRGGTERNISGFDRATLLTTMRVS